MGKYPNSNIHNKYSDWHWNLIKKDEKYKKLYVSDLDRLWLEYDFKRKEIVAIVDLKWEDSGDTLTPTEIGIVEWFKKKGALYYIVYITHDFERFRVINSDGLESIKTGIEYADWLLSLRNGITDEGFHEHIDVPYVSNTKPAQTSLFDANNFNGRWPRETLEVWIENNLGTKEQLERYKRELAWYEENT